MSSGVEITEVPGEHRFEMRIDGATVGLAAYVDRPGEGATGAQRVFTHTEVADRFEGQGLAGRLVAHALDATRDAGLRVVPVCPYVAHYLSRHHEWDDLVDLPTPELLADL